MSARSGNDSKKRDHRFLGRGRVVGVPGQEAQEHDRQDDPDHVARTPTRGTVVGPAAYRPSPEAAERAHGVAAHASTAARTVG